VTSTPLLAKESADGGRSGGRDVGASSSSEESGSSLVVGIALGVGLPAAALAAWTAYARGRKRHVQPKAELPGTAIGERSAKSQEFYLHQQKEGKCGHRQPDPASVIPTANIQRNV